MVAALPSWSRVLILDTPLWKLLATLLVVMLSIGALLAVHRWTRPRREDFSPAAYLRRLIVPVGVLLLALWFRLFFLLQINLQGHVAEAAELAAVDRALSLQGHGLPISARCSSPSAIVASPRIPDQGLDANLLRLAARITGLIAATTLLAYGARDLGIPVFGVIAGLGVGGLAVALAAQSTLGNLLGSVNLFADRPLRVGDVCQYGDKVGTVEQIGIRSTRIRGADRTVTTMPNADLAQMPITNFSRRDRILFQKRLDLRYETTPDQLRLLLIKLREMLLAHPRVSDDPARVRLVELASSSIQVEIFAYVSTRDWNDFLEVQQDLLLRIIELVNTIAAGFAFPSQTEYRPRDPGLDAADAAAASAEIEAGGVHTRCRSPSSRPSAAGKHEMRVTTRGSWIRLGSGIAAGAAFLLAGCSSMGPPTMARDRFDYGAAVAESWKQQTLLNIVKLRYLDVPMFVDVGQIVSGYTLETGVDLSGQVAPVDRGDTFLGLGGHGTFTDRPTITYTPMTGDKFLRGLLSPIPTRPYSTSCNRVTRPISSSAWSVESLNGLRNRSTAAGRLRAADPKFVHALELMREIQVAGGVSIGVEPGKTEGDTTVVVFGRESLPPETLEKSAALRRLLGLPADQTPSGSSPRRGAPPRASWRCSPARCFR